MARPREFNETEVVESAMHVFWRKGYQATSVQDLVEATGLQRGSLYGAFGDKHGLFMAALGSYSELVLSRLRSMLEQASDPVEGLREFVRMGGLDCMNERQAKMGCLVGNTCSELAADDEVVRRRVTTAISGIQATMADALRQGQRQGTFGVERDPVAVATFVQCSLQGLSVLARSNPGDDVINGVVGEILRVLE